MSQQMTEWRPDSGPRGIEKDPNYNSTKGPNGYKMSKRTATKDNSKATKDNSKATNDNRKATNDNSKATKDNSKLHTTIVSYNRQW